MSIKPQLIFWSHLLLAGIACAQLHPRLFFDSANVPTLQAKALSAPHADMLTQMIANINSYDYNQRGGNFAAAYLLTDNETYAEMAALRALDYISNTDRWENNSAWGLRRGIDSVAVAHLYDFCYNSNTWANMTVPATVTPQSFTVDGVTVWIPGDHATYTPDGVWVTSYTPRTVTVPSKYVGLPLREAISKALKNNADSLMASGGGAWPGNDKVGNNWHAVRYAGAGLGYLASDEDDAGKLDEAITKLKINLDATLSDSPLAQGWHPEGISYAQFPGWYTYPFALALERIEGRDLVAEHPAMRLALWSTYMGTLPIQRTSRLGEGLGVKPDFDDDHNVWEGEGTGALAFAFAYNDDPSDAIPDFDYRPGLKFMFRRLCGDLGDQQWDSASGNGIYSFLYYPDAISEQNPKDVWGLTYHDPTYGAVMFRNQYSNADFSAFGGGVFTAQPEDIVFQTTANLRDDFGGHDGPDDLTFRILGFGVPWAVGSGRTWDLRGQTNLSPFDPESFGPGDQGIVRWGNEIRDIFLRPNSGDGYVIMHMDTSPSGVRQQTRRMVVDYSGNSGADGFFLISDSCDDQNPWWRQQTIRSNTIDVSTPGQFLITSPDGHRMLGQVLYPAGVTCRTGEFQRGNPYEYRDNSTEDRKWNRWVDFEAGTDGEVLVALALVEAGQPLPVINVTGDPVAGFTVTAGTTSFTIDSDSVTSPTWNPPAITMSSPTAGQAIVAGAGGTGSVNVQGAASDTDGTIATVEVFLNDVLQQTLNFSTNSINWGPVTLSGLSLGDHTIKAIATDSTGDTRTASAEVSVTNSIPPEVDLTFPTRSSKVFAGQTLVLRGTISDVDNAVQRVEIWGEHIANNPDLKLLGNASINPTDGTWSYTMANIALGEHTLYAVAVDATNDATTTDSLIVRAGLRYSSADEVYGDAANFSYMTEIGATGRWSVVDDGGNLALRVLPQSGSNYHFARTYLQDSRLANYPDFEISWRAKPASALGAENNYILHFGADVFVDLFPYNSIQQPNPWTNVGRGTRIFYQAAVGGHKPEIGFTHNMHLTSDPGYPNNPASDRAGVPGTDWADVTVRRVGTQMTVAVNGVEIIDATHNYLGTRGEVGFGNDRNDGFAFLIDDVDFTPLDSAGNAVNDTGSTLAFTAPANFSQLAEGIAVNLTGTATDPDGLAKVSLFRGARKVADLVPDGSGNWSHAWANPLFGRYAFHLEATDTRGFVTRSVPLALTVASSAAPPANAAPTITISRDIAYTGALRLTGTASDPEGELAGVQIFRSGILIGNGTLNGSSWTFDIGSPQTGAQSYTARVYDQSGLSGDSSELPINLTAPQIALDPLPSGAEFTVGLPVTLSATVTAGSESVSGVTFYANGQVIGSGSLLGGAWTVSWTPRFYGDFDIMAQVTDQIGFEVSTGANTASVVPDSSPTSATVAYSAAEQFLDVMKLSDGTLLIAGTAADLNWLPGGTAITSLSLPGNFPGESTGRTAFLLHTSGDLQSIHRVYAIPNGRVQNLRWIKTTSKPGDPTATLYVSGSSNSADEDYFIAKLNGNVVNASPTGFDWVVEARVTGVNAELQAWDIDAAGNLAFVDQTDLGDGLDRLYVRFFDGNGQPRILPQLRGTHFDGSSNLTAAAPAWTAPAGTDASVLLFGRDLTSTVTTDAGTGLVTSGLDENGDGTADYLEVWPDGNGSLRQGLWPQDIFLPLQSYGSFNYGYNGYRSAGNIRIGGIAYDRDTGDFFIGYNNQSKFWSFSLGGDTPDFEPALIAYASDGSMKWWSRLYSEVVDLDDDGEIDPITYAELAALGQPDPQYAGEPQPCPPDQYVDGVAIDYSTSPGTIVVNGRCHGNAPNNFWSGDDIHAQPGAKGFQNNFTGTEGNIHVSWIGKLKESTTVAGGAIKPVGELQAASWISGYFRDIAQTQDLYLEPIHDNWPSHNNGWPNLTTTRIEPGSVRIDSSGRVYFAGVGPRMVTSFNAYQKIPRHTGTLNEGVAPWHNFVRVLSSDLSTLVYSSALTGIWTANSLTEQPVGANNTILRGVFPGSDGVLVAGLHGEIGGVAEGNPIPVNKVPAWGHSTPSGETALIAILPFATSANIAPSVALTQPSASLGFPPSSTLTLAATASDADGTIDRVEFYANGSLIHSDTTEPYSYDWTPGGAEGSTYTVLAQAIDNNGSATISSSVQVKLESVPTVALTSPADGSVAAIHKPKTLTATASDTAPGTVVRVEFLVNGSIVGSDTTAPYSIDWTPSTLGNHNLTARAIDNTGGVGLTPGTTTVEVIEGNVAPTISLLTPVSGMLRSSSDPLLMQAIATDESGIVSVTFHVNGQAVGTGIMTTGDIYELLWTPTLSGALSVSATVVDDGQPDNDVLSTSTPTISMILATSTIPTQPGGLTASALSWNRVQLDWSHSSHNESGYEIERRLPAGSWTSVVTLAANLTSYTDIGLLASTSYEYRVRALNALGQSAWSNLTSVTTPTRPGVDFLWNNASGNHTWDFASANFSTGTGIVAWANDIDLHSANFNAQTATTTLDEAIELYAISNLRQDITGNGSLLLGAGGLSVITGSQRVDLVPITLAGNQTWTMNSDGISSVLTSSVDTVLTVQGKGAIRPDNNQWQNFLGTLRLVPDSGQQIKVESYDFSTPAAFELVDSDGYANTTTRALMQMRGSGTIGGIAGNGYAFADLGRAITLTLDVPLARTINFAGRLYESDTTSGNGLKIIKRGLGTQIFSAAAEYIKETEIEAGTLIINGSKSGIGSVTVHDGATLAGAGSLAGDVTVQSGGILDAGANTASIGTLALDDNLVFEDDAEFSWQHENTISDLIDLSGNLTLPTGTIQLHISKLGLSDPSEGDMIPLINVGGTINNFAGTLWNIDLSNTPWTSAQVIETTSGLALTGIRVRNFANWIADEYPAIPLSERGPEDNPDHDAFINIEEYLHGFPPNSSANPVSNPVRIILNTAGNTVIRYRLNKQARDMDYTIEYSANLIHWTASTQPGIVVNDHGDSEDVEVLIPVSPDARKVFVRILMSE